MAAAVAPVGPGAAALVVTTLLITYLIALMEEEMVGEVYQAWTVRPADRAALAGRAVHWC
jgi:hypothetical protein